MKFTTLALLATASALTQQITIEEEGQKVQRWIVGGDNITVNGDSVTLPHNSGAHINNQPNNDPGSFQMYNLKGKTVAFDVDISSVGCSCNAAFYMVTMPGYNSQGQPDPSSGGDYYCDANQVGGVWCWEMDIMEANKYVSATTPHKCWSPAGAYISGCDRGGCGVNNHDWWSQGFGPGSQYAIDTNKPFTQWTTFSDGRIHIKLGQEGRYYDYDACSNDAGYIYSMDSTFESGMNIVLSHWGDSWSTMSWLDQNTGCQGGCDGSGHVTWSNIKIYTEPAESSLITQ